MVESRLLLGTSDYLDKGRVNVQVTMGVEEETFMFRQSSVHKNSSSLIPSVSVYRDTSLHPLSK